MWPCEESCTALKIHHKATIEDAINVTNGTEKVLLWRDVHPFTFWQNEDKKLMRLMKLIIHETDLPQWSIQSKHEQY